MYLFVLKAIIVANIALKTQVLYIRFDALFGVRSCGIVSSCGVMGREIEYRWGLCT
jgi:hypothetical protein